MTLIKNKKLFFFVAIVAASYVLGLFTYRNELFPLNVYRSVATEYFEPQPVVKQIQPTAKPVQPVAKPAQPIAKPVQPVAKPGQDVECPVANRRSATPLKNLRHVSNLSKYNMMLGDSLILHMFDPRLHGFDDWVAVGQGSQTTKCLVSELDWFFDLNPKRVFLYIGGNDTDRGILPATICNNMSQIVQRFIDTKTELILSEIHYGLDSRRRSKDVQSVNKCINEIAHQHELIVIPTLPEFKFENEEEAFVLSVDGEHLNNKGYSLWISHLRPILEKIQRGDQPSSQNK